jgi:GxxExxY protein
MKVFEPLPAEIESLAKQTVDASLKVHRALGPGLLESVYGRCLSYELRKRGLKVETQVLLPVVYDGVYLEAGLRLDFLIDKQLIVEVKAVQQMNPLFKAQVLTYLKLANLRLALLINFNVPLLRDGLERVIR